MLDYCKSDNQYLQQPSNMLYGKDVTSFLHFLGVKTIPAGSVMVLCSSKNREPLLMFQVLVDTDIEHINEASLIYYMEGSVVILAKFIKSSKLTTTFRNCRFPTHSEYDYYMHKEVV